MSHFKQLAFLALTALLLLTGGCGAPTPPAATATAPLPTVITPPTQPSATPVLTPMPTLPETPVFNFSYGHLKLKTAMLSLEIKNGTLVYLKDEKTGEVLVNTDGAGQCQLGDMFAAGFISRNPAGDLVSRCPENALSVDFLQLDPYHGKLVYTQFDQPDNQSRLEETLSVDPQTGEVILQLTGTEAAANLAPAFVNLAFIQMTTPAVILASGVQSLRAEPPAELQTSSPDAGLYAPAMAVVQGEQSVFSVWSETTAFAPENLRLTHTPQQDTLILHLERDPKEQPLQTITSSPWRLGIYLTWVKAAQRWREKFMERTGARPLWENRTPWVRNIHAVFDSINQNYDASPEKYAELAAIAEPGKVAFFLWNGDRLVLFGDPTLASEIGRPTPETLAAMKKYGWPLILYHPYDLIYSQIGMPKRLLELTAKGWLPPNYTFTPDYPGTPENWFQYWQGLSANYYGGLTLSVIHPGALKFQDYLSRNIGDYAAQYQANGFYLDTLGRDGNFFFDSAKQVVDGQDYVLGEVNAIQRLNKDLPGLALMTEYQSPWVLPYVFYAWEGIVTYTKQADAANLHINHPLRTALMGSFVWTKDSNETPDDVLAALLGTLPEVSLAGDYGIAADQARWSQQRAKLFCEEELFNDIPDTWDATALAYYRGRSGHWFMFKRLGSTYGYVEILPNGREVVRLSK